MEHEPGTPEAEISISELLRHGFRAIAGVRIVYWMGTDANAIRRVLGHIFGPSVIKVVREPNLKAPKPFERADPNRGE